ncbi:hypothetical protein B0H17DRAFT_380395 [Mycena rosella]|uniref:Uncharacterized protein n=1 Tax=Mycena rosella TaxID=1033263 RepID=A0AAD7CND4_MYCRO|nr:hypothetical protein B0H17DRAFT_380395 [Mycena rosella]
MTRTARPRPRESPPDFLEAFQSRSSPRPLCCPQTPPCAPIPTAHAYRPSRPTPPRRPRPAHFTPTRRPPPPLIDTRLHAPAPLRPPRTTTSPSRATTPRGQVPPAQRRRQGRSHDDPAPAALPAHVRRVLLLALLALAVLDVLCDRVGDQPAQRAARGEQRARRGRRQHALRAREPDELERDAPDHRGRRRGRLLRRRRRRGASREPPGEHSRAQGPRRGQVGAKDRGPRDHEPLAARDQYVPRADQAPPGKEIRELRRKLRESASSSRRARSARSSRRSTTTTRPTRTRTSPKSRRRRRRRRRRARRTTSCTAASRSSSRACSSRASARSRRRRRTFPSPSRSPRS